MLPVMAVTCYLDDTVDSAEWVRAASSAIGSLADPYQKRMRDLLEHGVVEFTDSRRAASSMLLPAGSAASTGARTLAE
jgi:hypothetical protein